MLQCHSPVTFDCFDILLFTQISFPKKINCGEMRSCENFIFVTLSDTFQQDLTKGRKFVAT